MNQKGGFRSLKQKSLIVLKGGFKIDYLKTTKKEVYLIVVEPKTERRDFLIEFFDRNLIAYKELKNGDFKAYWHNWLELADLLEEQQEGQEWAN